MLSLAHMEHVIIIHDSPDNYRSSNVLVLYLSTVDNTGNRSPLPLPPPSLTVTLTTRKLHITININFLQIIKKTLPKPIKLLTPFTKKVRGSFIVPKYFVKVVPVVTKQL